MNCSTDLGFPGFKRIALGGASMRVKLSSLATLTVCLLFLASSAFAGTFSIPVANYSFETLPVGGLNNDCSEGGLYPGCAYSTGEPIPGWTITGATGQWTTGGYVGNPPAYDGSVLAYSNGGTISQNVIAAVAGETYTLNVEILHRTDVPMTGIAQLTLNGVVVATATGIDPGPGKWSDWTALFTATPAEAGQELGILLSGTGQQADFDYVQLEASILEASIDEPSTLATLLGSSIFGLAAVLRRKLI